MHSFFVIFFYSFASPILEKHDIFSIFEFLFSENRKKNIRVGEFLTGSVGWPNIKLSTNLPVTVKDTEKNYCANSTNKCLFCYRLLNHIIYKL